MKTPYYIRTFFLSGADDFSSSVPEGFVFKGVVDETYRISSPVWKTTEKRMLHENELKKFPNGFVLIVQAREIVEYVVQTKTFFKTLSAEDQKEVLEYYNFLGFKEKQKPKKPVSSAKKVIDHENNPVDFLRGEILAEKTFQLNSTISFFCPSHDDKVEVGPGEFEFVLIPSPMPQDDSLKIRWWVLKKQLPKIYGKSENSFQIVLGEYPS